MDIDAGLEHPFFVYGKGWASCNPDGTYQLYGLKCQRLQVGDICISMKQRDHQIIEQKQYYDLPYNNNNNNNCDLPQNLSRRPAETTTIPATNTISSARPAAAASSSVLSSLDMNPHQMMSSLPYPTNHLLDLQRSKFGIPQIIEPATASNGHHHQQRPLSHESTSLHERYGNYFVSSSMGHNPDMPIPMVLPHKTVNQLMTDDANDASAKKRRWSAPSSNFEDDNEEARNALLRGKYSH